MPSVGPAMAMVRLIPRRLRAALKHTFTGARLAVPAGVALAAMLAASPALASSQPIITD